MSIRSPRSPPGRGFMQLGTSHSDQDNMMDDTQGIPLAPVRSTASSTGARKPSQGLPTMDSVAPTNTNEKQGFFHRGRRRAQPAGPSRSDTLSSNEVKVNAMGRIYNKIIGFSVITRYLVYIVPVGIILAVPLIVIAVTGNMNTPVGQATRKEGDKTVVVPGPPMWKLFLWIELAWLTLWGAKVVVHLMPPVFMFFCGVVSAGTRKYATVIRALEIPLSLFFWALASWLIFKNLIMGEFDIIGWVSTLKTILGALFVSTAVFLGEKTIVQLISITYHQRSFANRIKDSKREVFLLGLLYDASRTLFPMYCPEFAEEDYIINDSIEMMLGGKKGKRKNGAATPMRIIGNVGRIGDKVTSVFGNLASEITGRQVFNPNSAHSIVVEALEKARTSEAMAKRIWMSFVCEGKDALFVEDIVEVLGLQYQEEAEEAFAAIDGDGNGDISLDEMVRKVIEIGKERKAITNSMKDISQALAVFDNILLFVVLLIVVFIFLAFFQSSFITTLATAGTALLSLSFIFAVTTQEFLGSCIFLFVKHPYDVGDRVDITGPEKEQLVVERISLLYTIFYRIDKMQTVQVPNIVLNNLWIENVTRSKAMKEVIDVNVSFDTTFEDIELLRAEIEKFVRHPDNSRDFQPDFAVGIGGVGDCDKLNLKIAIKHKSNWHNEAVRATRRSKFICALTLALKAVPIYGPAGGADALGAPENPTYSVAVSDVEAAEARKKSAKAKEEARMVPPKPERTFSNASRSGGIAGSPEMNTAQNLSNLNTALAAADEWSYQRDDTLNSRSPSMDRVRSNDIDDLRRSLTKRESQRSGRRKAGDTLPGHGYGGDAPGIHVTQPGFDEEAETGGNSPYAYQSSFPPTTTYPPPVPGQSPTFPPGNRPPQNPLQSAPQPSSQFNTPRPQDSNPYQQR
ncbi:mechanosensitive ion channel [Apiospora arundinis]|uniref:Mechanosensitive ion channel-domain-containing protein n=1 Tax=Apiospora arundinis TaxID=335852 RepID=A0ABR2IFK4_9PEZI